MADESLRGRFVWYELRTTDPKAAQAFYPDVAGWAPKQWGFGPFAYTMWMRGSTPVGGVVPLTDGAIRAGAPPHWLPYIGVPNVNATVKEARELGATPLGEPKDLPMIGRYAMMADPWGAVFAIFTPSMAMPSPGEAPKLGDFSWHELLAADHAAALSFYQALFGWEKRASFDSDRIGHYQIYGRNGERDLGGMFDKPAAISGPPYWVMYVRIDDINRVADIVKAKGGQVMQGPMEVPGGDHIAHCVDPQGAEFALHQVKPA